MFRLGFSMRVGLTGREGFSAIVMLQLFIVLLLQVSLILPPISQTFATRTVNRVCQGDHEQCGCSPSRINAGTCCCAISSMAPCCKKKALEKAQAIKFESSQPPCGKNGEVMLAAFEPFVPAVFIHQKQYAVAYRYPSHPQEALISRSPQPDVPPPKRLIVS